MEPALEDHSQHLIIRVTQYGLSHQSFLLSDLYKDLNLTNEESKYVLNVLTQTQRPSTDNPNHILVLSKEVKNEFGNTVVNKSSYTLVPNAFYNYVDYLEIKEARKAADQAREQSSTAITIAIWSLIAAIAFGVVEIFLPHLMK
ncbi:MAG: hypothetical protein U0U09_14265 [Cyclobacteriaceae bacterium]